VIEVLAEHGADLDARADDGAGSTSLTLAAFDRNFNVAINLLDCGASPDAPGMHGQTALEIAIDNGDGELARLLLSRGADPNSVGDPDVGQVPLHTVAQTLVEPDIVSYLVRTLHERGANLNARERWGETPLHFAARCNNRPVAEVLLELGADVDARNHAGRTPAHMAASEGHADMLELLIKHGADIYARDDQGRSSGEEAIDFVDANLAPNRPRPECPSPHRKK